MAKDRLTTDMDDSQGFLSCCSPAGDSRHTELNLLVRKTEEAGLRGSGNVELTHWLTGLVGCGIKTSPPILHLTPEGSGLLTGAASDTSCRVLQPWS
eukprot:superscaffoldBa00000006_g138